MGLRATVIKKYEVEYGKAQGFNYGAEEIASIIYEFCSDYYVGDDGCGGCSYDAIWEVDKDEFTEMIDELKKMTDEEYKEQFSRGEYTREDAISLFEKFLAETPEESLYVRFGWL